MQLKLAELRESRNYTKKDIADILNVTNASYTSWENGRRLIPTKRLVELADLFDVNIDYIICLTNLKIIKKRKKTSLDLKEIGIHIKEVRNELNATSRDIEKLLSIPHSRWLNYENGKFLISSWILIATCEKSGISADYVLGRSKVKYLSDLN